MKPAAAPRRLEEVKSWGLAVLSLVLLVLAFPNFDWSSLAWIALVPLLIAISRKPKPLQSFLLGWFFGTCFFYATCYWLTYSMIHYGGLSTWVAYILLIPGAALVGVFPGLFALTQAGLLRRWGQKALLLAPFLWVELEWLRLEITGQLWNAVGYSQAFHVTLIQVARWGGVYAVSFVILAINAALAFLFIVRTKAALVQSVVIMVGAVLVVTAANGFVLPGTGLRSSSDSATSTTVVIALQPNVPMEANKSDEDMARLLDLHLTESTKAVVRYGETYDNILVIWPESPMNFTWGSEPALRERLENFTRENHTSLLFNSQEVSPGGGFNNSALLINQEGKLVARYDKIRLMPFGEYVPLPEWLPGASRVRAIVGGFDPGNQYTLMEASGMRMGTFICIESAYPWIARNLTNAGAEVLVNISNDGYLGRTAVMRQHLANTVFRAVENDRPLLRVTNTGISANIDSRGLIKNKTPGFETATRAWWMHVSPRARTFYTRFGDLFVNLCGAVSVFMIALSFVRTKRVMAQV
jgi:apolipoprotein N-acyltransferase